MKAIAKTSAGPGVEIIDAPEPSIRPGCVKIEIQGGSVCGTDLHIYEWDAWAAGRIKPPLIIGHEFCGKIIEVAADVDQRQVGQFVASESHIVPLDSPYLKAGLGHVAPETVLLGVDTDGGFAEYAVIPWQNARPTDPRVPVEIAAFQDALGNAIHTVYDEPGAGNPVEGKTVLITGLGPIGLFAVGICKALGAAKIVGTEISAYRIGLAEALGIDAVVNPANGDPREALKDLAPNGYDAALEMSGHPTSLDLSIELVRPGGRISLLGLYKENRQSMNLNDAIFKGLRIQGIIGRKLWETWDQMGELLASGKLDLAPIVQTRPFTEVCEAMADMKAGKVGKIALLF